jgi:alpha-ribazole phosphatase
MDECVAVTLLRHGLTLMNKEKRYIGWTNRSLCCEGVSVFKKYTKRYPAADLVYSSDLNRCLQTAAILYPEKSPIVSQAFREIHFGEWEGKTYNELKANKHYQNWLSNFYDISPPQGERYDMFSDRLMKGWKRMTKQFQDTKITNIVIVTHGGPIRELLSKFAPESKPFWEWKCDPGTGYQLMNSRIRIRRGERCISLREVPLTENVNG